MVDDTKMGSRLNPFFHIALLNYLSSFMLYMSDGLFESAHLSIAVCHGVSPKCTVAVEKISYYIVRLLSLFQCMNSEWFRWWFVHGV